MFSLTMSDYTGVLVGRKQFDAANTEDEYDGGVVSIPLLSLPIIFWVCVGRMQIIIFGWKGGRPNVEMRIPHILC